ncbi:MAG: hypothetical protein WDM89_18215 [Rhizomicrobium sp.]
MRRDKILKKGIWYPQAFSHPTGHVHLRLSRAAIEGNLDKTTADVVAFRREYDIAKSAGFHTAIFSSEFFHSEMREEQSLISLREFLSQYFDEFQLVYYARRQDRMLASMHSTAVKGAWTTNPDALSVYESKGRYYFDHLAVCDLWSKVFDRRSLVCRVYERDKLISANVVDDFCTLAGVDLAGEASRPSSNESLSLETMWALLLVNGSKHKDNTELRRKLIAMGKKRNGRKIPMLTRADAERFYARFANENRRFFANYVDPNVAVDFSGEFQDFPNKLPHMTAEEIQAFIFG